MAERIIGRLQSPADENGVRHDIHLITTADAVIYNDEYTLKDKMDQLEPTLSKTKPSHPGVWFQTLTKEDEDGNILLDQLPVDPETGRILVDPDRDAVIIDNDNIVISSSKPESEKDHDKIWAQELYRTNEALPDGVIPPFAKDEDGNYISNEIAGFSYEQKNVTISSKKPDKPGVWLQDLGREVSIDEE